jgi:hypothetical protein
MQRAAVCFDAHGRIEQASGDAGDDGQGDAGTDLPSPKGSGEASAGAPSKTSGKQKGK